MQCHLSDIVQNTAVRCVRYLLLESLVWSSDFCVKCILRKVEPVVPGYHSTVAFITL